MKEVFRIDFVEGWALAATFLLPIEADSALAGWLAKSKLPVPDQDFPTALSSLQTKGYLGFSGHSGEAAPGFLESLSILCMNPVTLTALIRRNGRLTYAHFAQLKGEVVQFMPEDECLIFHSPRRAFELPDEVIPDWFQVKVQEGLSFSLPLEASALLVAACQLQAVREVLEENAEKPTFPWMELIQLAEDARNWLEIYQALGIPGISEAGVPKHQENIQLLIELGLLHSSDNGNLFISEKIRPFYEAWLDPDLCTVSFSIQVLSGHFPVTGSVLYGNGRLFLAELNAAGIMQARQLGHRRIAVDWIEQWISKSSELEPLLTPPPEFLLEKVGSDQATLVQNEPWKLVVTEGPGTGLEFQLTSSLTVGRNPENDVKLQYPKVSRLHARFELRSGSVWVQDLNSSNGTYVNGVRIRNTTQLKSGDAILIGDSTLRLVGPASIAFEGATLMGPPLSGSVKPPSVSSERCPRCGNLLRPGAKFCGKCGMRIVHSS